MAVFYLFMDTLYFLEFNYDYTDRLSFTVEG